MDRYVVFSTERRSWWGPNNMGYVTDLRKAGLYTYDEARIICEQANGHLPPDAPPEEIMVPSPLAFQLYANRRDQ